MSPGLAFELKQDVLHLYGGLVRDALVSLWSALPASGWKAMDLAKIDALDTAGLALLVEAVARNRTIDGGRPWIVNAPDAFRALCAAYRIDPELEGLPDAPFV